MNKQSGFYLVQRNFKQINNFSIRMTGTIQDYVYSRYVLGVLAHSPNFLDEFEDFLGKHTFETLEDFLDLSPLIFHVYHPLKDL